MTSPPAFFAPRLTASMTPERPPVTMTATSGRRVMRSAQPPELRIQAELVEDRFRLVGREATPVRVELVPVPRVREPSGLLDRQDVRRGRLRAFPPALGVLLRPEEKHGRSGEVDVLPEVTRADADLKHGPGLHVGPAVSVDLDHQRLVAVGAVRLHHTGCSKRGRDAER